jgi:hypothetical protein
MIWPAWSLCSRCDSFGVQNAKQTRFASHSVSPSPTTLSSVLAEIHLSIKVIKTKYAMLVYQLREAKA